MSSAEFNFIRSYSNTSLKNKRLCSDMIIGKIAEFRYMLVVCAMIYYTTGYFFISIVPISKENVH